MSLKIFKSYTKSTRGTVLIDRKKIWKGKSLKSLTFGKNSTGGRNNLGRITSRSRGAGHKHKYREIDFHRKKDDIKAKIERIEYDPNRSAHVALIKYEDGQMSYILAPNKIKVGDEIISGRNKNIKIVLSDPKGSSLYNHIKNGELKSEGNSITEGIGSSRITKNFDQAPIDDAYSINDTDALSVLFELLEKEGLNLGTSSGINIAGAIKLAENLGPNKTIVTVLCDTSDKYRSKMFNKKFLTDKGLPFPKWL